MDKDTLSALCHHWGSKKSLLCSVSFGRSCLPPSGKLPPLFPGDTCTLQTCTRERSEPVPQHLTGLVWGQTRAAAHRDTCRGVGVFVVGVPPVWFPALPLRLSEVACEAPVLLQRLQVPDIQVLIGHRPQWGCPLPEHSCRGTQIPGGSEGEKAA